jgi:hypothetical protein
VRARWRVWSALLPILTLPFAPAQAQEPVDVGALVTAFLADSGVATRGLPWMTGGDVPIEWESTQPVASAPYRQNEGLTQTRTGHLEVAVDSLVREATVSVHGNQNGIQRTEIVLQELDSWITGPLATAIPADGVALTPLKCDLATEPASYGNVVWVAKAPGKTASGLWMGWNCGHDGCGIVLTVLYRKADVDKVECVGGA